MPSSFGQHASRLRVPTGFLLGALVLALARANSRSLALGLPLALVGELLRVWAAGHIQKTQALATGGPYAHTRNPLYLGSIVMAAGFTFASASPWVALGVLAYLLTFYPSVIQGEAAFLRGKFPEAYAAWAAAVPLLLPRLTPAGPRESRFDWARVRSNREWQAALALPLVALFLYARSCWLPW